MAFYITDRNGTTLKINKMYEQLTGLKKEELLGRNVQDLRLRKESMILF